LLIGCNSETKDLQPIILLSQPETKQSEEIETIQSDNENQIVTEETVESETIESNESPWYQMGWVYLLGNQNQIIYESEIDQWNINAFKTQAEMMNMLNDPNCPCQAVWFL